MIFSIVVQGLHSLIATSPTSDIRLPHSDKPETIGQDVDDTTLWGSTMAEYDAYKSFLAIFEQASGMVLNWDKSFILWLGSWQTLPLQLPQTDQVQVAPPGNKLRVLGIKLGHYQDKHEASSRRQPPARSALSQSRVLILNNIWVIHI